MKKNSKNKTGFNEIFNRIELAIFNSQKFLSYDGFNKFTEIRNDFSKLESVIVNQQIKYSTSMLVKEFFNKILKHINIIKYTEMIYLISFVFLLPFLFLTIVEPNFSTWWFILDLVIFLGTKLYKLLIFESLKYFTTGLKSNLIKVIQ